MIQRFIHGLANSGMIQIPLQWSKKIIIPGFEGMSLFALLNFMLRSFKNSTYGLKSSAIAFKFFLAIFPGILFFVSIIPFVPIDNFQESILQEIAALMPNNIYIIIEQTINDLVVNKHHLVLGVGVVFTLFFASNGINAMLAAFNTSFQIELKRNPVKQRLIAFGIFLSISLFMIIGLSTLAYGEIIIYSIEYKKLSTFVHILFYVLKWALMLLSLGIAVSTLYNLGNPQRVSWKWFSPGATLATLITILASYGMSYFFLNFGSYNELYGSIGSMMMLLIWLNVVSYILLVGFELHTLSDQQRKNYNAV